MDIRPTDLPLEPVAGVPEVRLHQAVDLLWLWEQVQRAAADEAPFPFWATPWAGGVGLARHVLDHPGEVAGRTVWDVATGSGVVAIAAALAGASQVLASDPDPDAIAAATANADANGVDMATSCVDALAAEHVTHEVVLLGDACYDVEIAGRTRAFLRHAAAGGALVLLGDPGRPDLPRDVLVPVARYQIPDAAGLESTPLVDVQVWTPA